MVPSICVRIANVAQGLSASISNCAKIVTVAQVSSVDTSHARIASGVQGHSVSMSHCAWIATVSQDILWLYHTGRTRCGYINLCRDCE